MTLDTAIVLAAIVLATLWPTHQQLTIRALRHSLRRQHTSLHQQRRAIIQLQTIVTGLPTTSYQPMPTVTKVTATISGGRDLQPHTPNDRQWCAQGGPVNPGLWGREDGPELFVPYHGPSAAQVSPGRSSHRGAAPGCDPLAGTPGSQEPSSPPDADQTLRLARPPAMTDVAAAITNAGRPLTRAAITEQLGRDARTEIREQLLAGTLTMVRTHDSDPAYWPAGHGDTQRMGRMSVLPGVSQ